MHSFFSGLFLRWNAPAVPMARFLHIADIHLGFDRYNSRDRTRDFFEAFDDVLQRYAIGEKVDFVLIAGDLFEHKNVMPAILNQATVALKPLKEAGIPVLAIEGNHDNLPYGTRTSWLRYLSDWEWLMLLEPEDGEEPENVFQPWNPENRRGGYLDLDCGVRVLGSRWYGAAAPKAIAHLAAALGHLPPGPAQTVMMFHHGLEGQVARYSGALKYGELEPLKQAGVNYLALGHIHKNYEVEDWIFNPGSLEANSVAESRQQMARGAYLVEIGPSGVQAELKQDYQQRPVLRLTVEANKAWSLAELEGAAIEEVKTAAAAQKTQAAVVELRIRGQVGFERLDLNLRQLQEQLKAESEALIFLLKYEVTGTEYATPLVQRDRPSRQVIEQTVFQDFLATYSAYATEPERLDALTQGLITLKTKILAGQPEEELYQVTQKLLEEHPIPSQNLVKTQANHQ